ncbi:hypothetical protein [Elizabethkingia miricola]|uniref:hypothetical protein n=1 Tax=Elizabethkingia miricola TaxID=172045 RepID=UPI003891B30D
MEGKAKEALKEILDRCYNGIRLLNQVLEDKKSSSIEKNTASYQLNILKMFKGIAECELMEDIVKGNINSESSN